MSSFNASSLEVPERTPWPDKGAFTNDVIILGGRGFGKYDGGGGCWAKDDVTFLI